MTDDGYTIAIERPAPFAVHVSPQAMREAMVADELAIAARAGVPLSTRDAEAMVARDLAVFDAVEREAPAVESGAPSAVEQAERREENTRRRAEALAEADASSAHLVDARKSAVLQAASMPTDRWSYAKGRLSRLLRGYSKHPDPAKAAANCDQPALAVEIVSLMYAVARTQAHRQAGTWPRRRPRYEESNPFWGVSRQDFGRVLMRLAEDICDRSTGMPGYGPWWVPK